MTSLKTQFGVALRQARREHGWSQEELAEHAALDRSYLGEIERGQVTPTLSTLEKLASALGIRPSALILRAEMLTRESCKQDPDKKIGLPPAKMREIARRSGGDG